MKKTEMAYFSFFLFFVFWLWLYQEKLFGVNKKDFCNGPTKIFGCYGQPKVRSLTTQQLKKKKRNMGALYE